MFVCERETQCAAIVNTENANKIMTSILHFNSLQQNCEITFRSISAQKTSSRARMTFEQTIDNTVRRIYEQDLAADSTRTAEIGQGCSRWQQSD